MPRRFVLTILCLIFAILFVSRVAAQDRLQGEISADLPTVDFALELTAGTTVSLTTDALNPALDPMLILYAPSGAMLASNDDFDGRNASITYAVEASGTYTARVRGFGGTTGKFELIVAITEGEVGALIAGVTPYASLPQSRAEDGAFVLGDPAAPITVIIFADWMCPHCREYQVTVEQFLAEYVVTGQANFESRIFPTAGGDLTRFTVGLVECADELQAGSYWQAYPLLYEYANEGRFNQEIGRVLAQELELDYTDLLTCSETATQVDTDVAYGRAVQITGTPAVLVRYGDSPAEWITHVGITYNRGSVPLDVLGAVIEAAQP